MVKRLFGLTPLKIRSLPSYDDQNFYVAPMEGGEYVLKIMNSADSKNLALIEVQTYAMTFLHKNGLPSQTALSTSSGQLMSLEEIDYGCGCQKYLVLPLTYLPGIAISKVPVKPQLLFETAKTAARVDKILQELLQREKFLWSLSNVTLLEEYINVLDGHPVQEVVSSVIRQYRTCVIPNRSGFRKSANIHELAITIMHMMSEHPQPIEVGGPVLTG